MNARLGNALWAETLKLRRSHLPFLSAAAMSLAPLMGGVIMFAMRQPGDSQLAAKAAAFAATPDWPGYLKFLVIGDAAAGLLVFGMVAAWVFGREFSDRTAIDLLALPTPRAATVVAKFVVIALWAAVLTALVPLLGLAVGIGLGLPGWSGGAVLTCLGQLVVASGLSVLLVTPLAFAASVGRGYLPAIGLMLLVMVVAQVLAQLGFGPWFPWSVPGLATGVAGPGADQVGVASYMLVAVTGLAGIALTAYWWLLADQR